MPLGWRPARAGSGSEARCAVRFRWESTQAVRNLSRLAQPELQEQLGTSQFLSHQASGDVEAMGSK